MDTLVSFGVFGLAQVVWEQTFVESKSAIL